MPVMSSLFTDKLVLVFAICVLLACSHKLFDYCRTLQCNIANENNLFPKAINRLRETVRRLFSSTTVPKGEVLFLVYTGSMSMATPSITRLTGGAKQ